MDQFHGNLKRMRIRRDLTQDELARRMNVTRQTVSGWETGRRQPDLDTLKKLAQVLNADIQELIYGSNPETYTKFQRKFVIRTTAWTVILAILLLLRLLIWPRFKVLCATNHWGGALFSCHYVLPVVGAFAFGALIPSLLQLFIPIRLRKRLTVLLLVAGVTAPIPAILFWLGVLHLSTKFLFSFGFAFILYILPFVSGICISSEAICEII